MEPEISTDHLRQADLPDNRAAPEHVKRTSELQRLNRDIQRARARLEGILGQRTADKKRDEGAEAVAFSQA